jgi:hypothetical protein
VSLALGKDVMSTAVVSASPAPAWPGLHNRSLSLTRSHAKVAAVALTTVLAIGLRISALSTYGLSEDEVHKVRAVEQYKAGNFSANAEHPMLLKLAIWGSDELAAVWNAIAPSGQTIAPETAVRLPNAVAGALTTVAVFGVADVLFGTSAALLAGALWAVDVNAIATSRIAKEDTLLVLFFLAAVWCYERAKRIGITDAARAQRWYGASGASFGLMLASKYFPHLLGIYSLFNLVTDRTPGSNRPRRRRFLGLMFAAFLIADMAIVLPETWRYCLHYVQGGMLMHHGYVYQGQLYVNNIPLSPIGVPATYYLRFIATKVPIVVLLSAIVGLVEIARHRTERGFVLLRMLLVLLLVPYSLMASKFLRYTLPMLVVIDMIAAVGLIRLVRGLNRLQALSAMERRTLSAAVLTLSLASVSFAAATSGPFYSLYQNVIGDRLAAPGTTFPEETYDFGVREAVGAIAVSAGQSAAVVSDVPEVVAEYLRSAGRGDVQVRSLSAEGIPQHATETWVIVQNEHITFENQPVIEQLRHRERPWREFRAATVPAAEVFRLEGRDPCVPAPLPVRSVRHAS